MARDPPAPCPSCNSPPPTPLDPLRPYLAPTLSFLTALALYRLYLRNRRIPTAADLPSSYLRQRTLHGRIVAVNDPDNIHLFHTPLGVLNSIPKRTRGGTIHVRLAGVDAPELAHFGSPEQPHARDALRWTREKALGRRARVRVYSKDQYGRVVGRVEVKRGWGAFGLWWDLGGWMLREGWATVYDAKTGAEFGGRERRYRKAEEWARRWRRGMWREGAGAVVRPGEFKAAEKAKGNGGVAAGKGKVIVVGKAAGRKGVVTPAVKATAVKTAVKGKRKKLPEEQMGYPAWIWSLITGKQKT